MKERAILAQMVRRRGLATVVKELVSICAAQASYTSGLTAKAWHMDERTLANVVPLLVNEQPTEREKVV